MATSRFRRDALDLYRIPSELRSREGEDIIEFSHFICATPKEDYLVLVQNCSMDESCVRRRSSHGRHTPSPCLGVERVHDVAAQTTLANPPEEKKGVPAQGHAVRRARVGGDSRCLWLPPLPRGRIEAEKIRQV
eukprot:CAMPEP_0175812888 /NCGR_PEP_ID=MMETSP0107_2-20121207/4617_1 /TAXON_ID=195067 ORGANISM="Goniomonas pacifica, Strain CCMP1869" /NCGR_SAMPLE_ID=MMETSP0107_2 /ASSEMBLY_ACC=CAM_ASM_000203 /LENGTH=133 /DNA_ID=CAMNT_0017124781 /DNA_START=329 /DNA_END=730 /DNA_ORIENTATION=-